VDSKNKNYKKSILAFFVTISLCLIGEWGCAQKYIVLKVTGSVSCSGQMVKPWDELEPASKLSFGSDQSALRVMQGNNVFVVSATKAKPGSGNELVAILKDAFLPEKPPVNRASTKGLITSVEDIAMELGQSVNGPGQTVLIIDQKEFSFSKSIYAVSNENFFFVRYQYNNEVINKKLENSSSNGFVLSTSIFSISMPNGKTIIADRTKINGPFKLYYFIDAHTSELVAEFNAVFIASSDLIKELSPLVRRFKDEHFSAKEMNLRVAEYLTQYYGAIDDDQLNQLMLKF